MIGKWGLDLTVIAKLDSHAFSSEASLSLDSAVAVIGMVMVAAHLDAYLVWWWQ